MGFLSDALGLITGATQRRRWLEQHGTPVEATPIEVRQNTIISINGRSPYQITAQWVLAETNQLYIFKSKNLWYDPTSDVTVDSVRVLIDASNPKRYFMDISFLPKLSFFSIVIIFIQFIVSDTSSDDE